MFNILKLKRLYICMYYSIELLSLLNLELNKNYSRDYIFAKIKKKLVQGNELNLWKVDTRFLNLIMNYKLIGTNKTFYRLFYLKDHKWRKHYKIGFTKKMIYKMIDSLLMNSYEPLFVYKNTGNVVHEIIL